MIFLTTMYTLHEYYNVKKEFFYFPFFLKKIVVIMLLDNTQDFSINSFSIYEAFLNYFFYISLFNIIQTLLLQLDSFSGWRGNMWL